MSDFIPPTPERIAKGDIIPTKRGGKSWCNLRIDYLHTRGVIDDEQHKACLKVRYWFDAFGRQLGAKISGYGKQSGSMSLQDNAALSIDNQSRYTSLMRELPPIDAAKFSAVVCHDDSLTQARIAGDDFRRICDKVVRLV